mmetsp:Transcript_89601/g.278853  ORF Transcript_89601/g.278853 Transcript_89601/m.278853 type:complete len:318 (-) Transcript_89601:404-1357(-)
MQASMHACMHALLRGVLASALLGNTASVLASALLRSTAAGALQHVEQLRPNALQTSMLGLQLHEALDLLNDAQLDKMLLVLVGVLGQRRQRLHARHVGVDVPSRALLPAKGAETPHDQVCDATLDHPAPVSDVEQPHALHNPVGAGHCDHAVPVLPEDLGHRLQDAVLGQLLLDVLKGRHPGDGAEGLHHPRPDEVLRLWEPADGIQPKLREVHLKGEHPLGRHVAVHHAGDHVASTIDGPLMVRVPLPRVHRKLRPSELHEALPAEPVLVAQASDGGRRIAHDVRIEEEPQRRAHHDLQRLRVHHYVLGESVGTRH